MEVSSEDLQSFLHQSHNIFSCKTDLKQSRGAYLISCFLVSLYTHSKTIPYLISLDMASWSPSWMLHHSWLDCALLRICRRRGCQDCFTSLSSWLTFFQQQKQQREELVLQLEQQRQEQQREDLFCSSNSNDTRSRKGIPSFNSVYILKGGIPTHFCMSISLWLLTISSRTRTKEGNYKPLTGHFLPGIAVCLSSLRFESAFRITEITVG